MKLDTIDVVFLVAMVVYWVWVIAAIHFGI